MECGYKVTPRVLLGLVVLLASSCDQSQIPDRGFVTGKVTMNGKPVLGADIGAFPFNGRPAYGIVQPDGSYELMYKKNVPGTPLGVSKFSPIWPTSVRGPAFPPEYLDIEFDVKPGHNVFNLEMKSDRQAWIDFKPAISSPPAIFKTTTPIADGTSPSDR